MEPPLPLKIFQPHPKRISVLEQKQVELTYYGPEATLVQVGGDFNNWLPATQPLEYIGFGEWMVRLKLNSGRYEYRFVVDGRWTDDPQATESSTNAFGAHNSLLRVG